MTDKIRVGETGWIDFNERAFRYKVTAIFLGSTNRVGFIEYIPFLGWFKIYRQKCIMDADEFVKRRMGAATGKQDYLEIEQGATSRAASSTPKAGIGEP